jgi:hypothetical protein
MLVNETGRPGVADDYMAVLTQMGYQVVGVTNGFAQTAGAGGTVISYRPDSLAQAQALARRLPGKKEIVKGESSLPAGAVVTIR